MRGLLKKNIHKSPVSHLTLRPRESRHGRPLTDVFMKPEVVQVTRGTRVNKLTGEIEAFVERKVLSVRRPMRPDEIEAARHNVLRALRSTTDYAQKNVVPSKVGKK
jgi:hypothetical protein